MEDINRCKHCGHTITEEFCGKCGQRRFRRIDRKYVADEVADILQTNRGLFYTLKNLVIRPGQTARKFVDGDRIKHFKPLLLVFVLGGFSAFVSFKLLHIDEVIMNYTPYQNKELGDVDANLEIANKFMDSWINILSNYIGLVNIALLPIYAWLTRLVFKNWGHNYYEHIAINAYMVSIIIIAQMIFTNPLLYIFRNSLQAIFLASSLNYLGIPVIFWWFFKGFYAEHTNKEVIIKIATLLAMIFAAFILFIILVAIVVISLTFIIIASKVV